MNEPNTQQEQAAPQPPKKMSSRATNFLMMNAAAGGPAPEPESEPSASAAYTEPHYVETEAPPAEAPQPKRATGVVGSTIYPAQRQGNQPQD
ncbi:MAG: hypothetical protein CVV27_11025, partial [Candidatus Melainabacteria bacterium HGW-Melainabacteria-1]